MTAVIIIWAAVSSRAQTEDDKVSLPAQIADGQAFAAANGFDIIDTLVVPGYSRDFLSSDELIESADNAATEESKAAAEAFRKLLRHIAARDFDVFWCRDADRFGREQPLVAEIALKIVRRAGARIYSKSDGWIDERNVRMWVAMKGLSAAQDIDRLKEYRRRGIVKRAERGLTIAGRAPHTHRVLRGDDGKELGIALKPEYVAFYNDLAALLLAGLSYHQIPFALAERGHTRHGKPYGKMALRLLLHRPTIWGHQAVRMVGNGAQNYGLWGLDASTPPPPGVLMMYDTHDPVYIGALAEQVKAELRRRATLHNNKSAMYVKKFAGLILCDTCHGPCRYIQRLKQFRARDVYYAYYVCRQAATPAWRGGGCTQHLSIRETAVQEFLTPYLRRWVELKAATFADVEAPAPSNNTDLLRQSIATLDKRIDALIDELSLAEDAVKPALRRRLAELQADADKTQRQLDETLRASVGEDKSRRGRAQALDAIAAKLDVFWEQDSLWINQQLRALFGSMRMVLRDKQIIGFVDSKTLKK